MKNNGKEKIIYRAGKGLDDSSLKETIGDSYVAVAGLPNPRKDHAVVMAKFARDCRDKMAQVTKDLEVTLGPDTGELLMRFGLNSGAVTAGVLRGERSRFQLFGDTVREQFRIVEKLFVLFH